MYKQDYFLRFLWVFFLYKAFQSKHLQYGYLAANFKVII